MKASVGSGAQAGTVSLDPPTATAGGPQLRTVCLTPGLFESSEMMVVSKDLMDMKVTELKDELNGRDEPKTGNKAWLRRRLHAAIVRDHIASHESD